MTPGGLETLCSGTNASVALTGTTTSAANSTDTSHSTCPNSTTGYSLWASTSTPADQTTSLTCFRTRLLGTIHDVPRKVDAIFAHICNSYGDDGTSPYNTLEPAPIIPPSTPRTLSDLDSVSEIDEEFLDRCKQDPVLFAELMHHLLGANTRGLMPRPDDELLRQMDQDEVRLNRCVALT
jgi:hypothetical protein